VVCSSLSLVTSECHCSSVDYPRVQTQCWLRMEGDLAVKNVNVNVDVDVNALLDTTIKVKNKNNFFTSGQMWWSTVIFKTKTTNNSRDERMLISGEIYLTG
jgi:hypothetical protein